MWELEEVDKIPYPYRTNLARFSEETFVCVTRCLVVEWPSGLLLPQACWTLIEAADAADAMSVLNIRLG